MAHIRFNRLNGHKKNTPLSVIREQEKTTTALKNLHFYGHVLARSPPPCPPFSNQKWDYQRRSNGGGNMNISRTEKRSLFAAYTNTRSKLVVSGDEEIVSH